MMGQKNNARRATTRLGLTAEEAAGAAIAQTISMAAQNEVDAFRNQNTINMVAMGTAYAKWLQNPLMSEQFGELVHATRLHSTYEKAFLKESLSSRFMKTAATENSAAKVDSEAAEKSEPQTLPMVIFSHFLGAPDKPE